MTTTQFNELKVAEPNDQHFYHSWYCGLPEDTTLKQPFHIHEDVFKYLTSGHYQSMMGIRMYGNKDAALSDLRQAVVQYKRGGK